MHEGAGNHLDRLKLRVRLASLIVLLRLEDVSTAGTVVSVLMLSEGSCWAVIPHLKVKFVADSLRVSVLESGGIL